MSAKSIKATEKVRIMVSKTTGLRQPTILLDFLKQKVRLADIKRSKRLQHFETVPAKRTSWNQYLYNESGSRRACV